MERYIGHESQLYGVEEVRLVGGKGDGMRLLQVKNGAGLEFTVSLDRAADISRISYDGVNLGYFAPCGYVAPTYYDNVGCGFLKSFTAGFITTCGLTNVGGPCEDNGEQLGQHGNISHIPAEQVNYYIENGEIHIKARMRDASLFGTKLVLEREYIVPLFGNTLYMNDTIKNVGTVESPFQMLYHCNVGYPLLSEDTIVDIPSDRVTAADDYAAADIENRCKMQKPTPGFGEMCYFHEFDGKANVSIYNPKIQKGLVMSFDGKEFPCFCEWKAMGEDEYVLGIEPGNSPPTSRNIMRENGKLAFLKPGEHKVQHIKFEFKR